MSETASMSSRLAFLTAIYEVILPSFKRPASILPRKHIQLPMRRQFESPS